MLQSLLQVKSQLKATQKMHGSETLPLQNITWKQSWYPYLILLPVGKKAVNPQLFGLPFSPRSHGPRWAPLCGQRAAWWHSPGLPALPSDWRILRKGNEDGKVTRSPAGYKGDLFFYSIGFNHYSGLAAPFQGRGWKSAQTILVLPSISYTPEPGLTLPGYCWLAFIREKMPKWVRIEYKLENP